MYHFQINKRSYFRCIIPNLSLEEQNKAKCDVEGSFYSLVAFLLACFPRSRNNFTNTEISTDLLIVEYPKIVEYSFLYASF